MARIDYEAPARRWTWHGSYDERTYARDAGWQVDAQSSPTLWYTRSAQTCIRCSQLPPVDVTDAAVEALEDHQRRVRRSRISEAESGPVSLAAGVEDALFDYQRGGVELILRDRAAGRGTLLADEMGLGKTVQALAAVDADSPADCRTLVVCPASVRYVWESEIRRWLPHRRIALATGPADFGAAADFIVASYACVRNNAAAASARHWRTVILDEAHYIKNPDAGRTAAILGSDRYPGLRCDHRLAITGTPFLNNPAELWGVLHWLDDRTWPSDLEFYLRYCAGRTNQFGEFEIDGASHLEELQDVLRGSVLIRRELRDVSVQLPELRHQVLEFDATGDPDVLARSHRLIGQVRLDEAAPHWPDELGEHLARERAELAKAKVQHARALVNDWLAAGHSVAVFGWTVEALRELAAAYRDPPYRAQIIVGDTSDAARRTALDEFQAGRSRVFVGNFRAAGVGLTLTAADRMVILEHTWSPNELDQVVKRLHRVGQTRPVLVQYLTARRTLDALMVHTCVRKMNVFDHTFNTHKGV